MAQYNHTFYIGETPKITIEKNNGKSVMWLEIVSGSDTSTTYFFDNESDRKKFLNRLIEKLQAAAWGMT